MMAHNPSKYEQLTRPAAASRDFEAGESPENSPDTRHSGNAQQQASAGEGTRRPWVCRQHAALAVLLVTALLVCIGASTPVIMLVNGSSYHPRKMAALPETGLGLNSSSEGQVYGQYRTRFHFQPQRNWINDPNGPIFFNGYYHLFYQYNPYSAVWGNMTWGHAVSPDLLQWSYLPIALERDQWYDINGVWSGSATLYQGSPMLVYTGAAEGDAQSQNLAFPADVNDPFLRNWIKSPLNPVAEAPAGINRTDFRDPTTAWQGSDGLWRVMVGAKRDGVDEALVYRTSNFSTWVLNEAPMRTASTRRKMWECPDFFPVSNNSTSGLETSANGLGILHVLKASFDDTRNDYYSVGFYVESNDTWTPLKAELDVETGLMYDYGAYYASKSFYDNKAGRRILVGWVNESDSVQDDLAKGWACVHAIPRTLWLDESDPTHLIELPVDEVAGLRTSHTTVGSTALDGGQVVEISGGGGAQLDIEVSFRLPYISSEALQASQAQLASGQLSPTGCSALGATQAGVVGPFGVVVLGAGDLSELTAVYFEMLPTSNATWKVRLCSDQTRSSLDPSDEKSMYGADVRVLEAESDLTMRILVDNSIVETFAQGGRTVITARAYPTRALGASAHTFLFNNGSVPVTVQEANVWQMEALTFATI
eukprot:TRINITY_DN32514_c0_g1_i1.p1 TRINITY_DN32514_c0_g1~~TRINITY_DN32514_c0_g1_i1.p1  ORF type:complete len:651 (-),score=99.35 TRINITY_DN32514_c0_g1_i1:235-2187(-)